MIEATVAKYLAKNTSMRCQFSQGFQNILRSIKAKVSEFQIISSLKCFSEVTHTSIHHNEGKEFVLIKNAKQ